jgi:phosphoenolpyruvate carboxylase
LHVMEVYGLFLLAGWKPTNLNVDIIPLFETVEDLQHAATVMQQLYTDPVYKKHLARRGNKQTIMVGFSDGTKDGGYLMANWSIYKAKEELTAISRGNNIDVIFFDGRGGPPARGGGKSHKFYASMGNNIANKEIQLTIQGQTVSSNFGMQDAARYNIEQLLHAGLSNDLLTTNEQTLEKDEALLLQELAEASFLSYDALKKHPQFLEYLSHTSPLNFYGLTNIGSRPTKRGKAKELSLTDLRAIPFVGAWSQLKQNVTGYYGVGTALKQVDDKGKLKGYKKLYKSSLFFRTMIDNCEMSMKKCFFPLTAYLSKHPVYGDFWKIIYKEYQLSEKYLLQVTGKKELMADYPVEQLSIEMRERIVLPLVTIQQYAITRFRELDKSNREPKLKEIYGKLVMRCSFGIINAGRNSA